MMKWKISLAPHQNFDYFVFASAADFNPYLLSLSLGRCFLGGGIS